MRKLILLLLTVIVIGCGEKESVNIYCESNTNGIEFIVIDSCEYLVNKEGYANPYSEPSYKTYTHKGNCKYCAERRQKELGELVMKIKGK